MNDGGYVFACVLAGLLLGGMYFGGLWWTTRRALQSANPALWFLVSSLLRNALLLGGLYLLAAGSWQRILASLAGILLARMAILRLSRVRD